MSPRRKKADEADEFGVMPESGEAEEAKPKKRASAKKAAPKRKKPSEESDSPESYVSSPWAKPDEPAEPIAAPRVPAPKPPVVIPIRPIPPIAVPPRMVIEPDVHIGDEIEDLWKPSPREESAPASPPKVLLERKKVQKQEVEDVLYEPEDAEHEPDREGLRPVVRTGAFRKIAMGFAVLAVIVGALAAYVVYARATVTVYPQKSEISTEQDLTVADDPKDGDVPGQVVEVTVTGERTEAPSDSAKTDGIAHGTVTLVNDTANEQALVATTRLLTSSGVLFRLKSYVNVPAHGSVKADAYADKPGDASDIGPSAFTIPGLSAIQQKSIYAKSDAAMAGGTVSRGIISAADIDKAEGALRDDLTSQAKAEMAKSIDQKWTGQAYVVETMSRTVSAAAGETADGVTVRLSLRVRAAGFDKDQALTLAKDDLKRGLTSDRELLSADVDHAAFSLTSADPKAGTASLHIVLKGESQVSLNGPALDPSSLKGRSLADVQLYFAGLEGVQKVDVAFNPFWIKRMPDLPDHIKITIQR